MDVDTSAVHRREPPVEIDELVGEGIGEPLGAQCVAFLAAVEPGAFGGAVALEEPQPIGRIPVGVDVDRADALLGFGAHRGSGEREGRVDGSRSVQRAQTPS